MVIFLLQRQWPSWEKEKSGKCNPYSLLPRNERGGDLGSLRVKVKIYSMELMVRGNMEKERGAKTNGRQSKLVTLGKKPF